MGKRGATTCAGGSKGFPRAAGGIGGETYGYPETTNNDDNNGTVVQRVWYRGLGRRKGYVFVETAPDGLVLQR
eukprot:2684847-Amphidinium_carterae.1